MQAYATMLRIYAAEKYYSLSTILLIYPLERSYQTYFRHLRMSSCLDSASGCGMYIILLNRRLAAGSSSAGRLVAPISRTSPLLGLFTPSINTKNSVLSLLAASFSFSDLAVSMESIQSMKIIAGASFSAPWKMRLSVFQLYPTSLFRMHDAERARKAHLHSLASALQMQVFPFPGGPYKRRALGGARMPVYRSGRCLGRITAYSNMDFTQPRPTMSLKETSSCLTRTSFTTGSSISLRKMGLRYGSVILIQTLSFWSGYVGTRMALVGKPKPMGLEACIILAFPLVSAYTFSVWNLRILFLSCSMVSLEVAQPINYRRMVMILSQQREAYSQLPSVMKFSALVERVFARANFYINII